MNDRKLAVYTFEVFREAADAPVNQGFYDRNERNFRAAEMSEGFVARSGYADVPGPESWGDHVYPRFYVERGDGWSPSTLSLWRDLPEAMAYSYGPIHAEAMRHARDWFVPATWPPYALWWTDPGARPDWAEAVARHALLHERGPTAEAFDFKTPFDAGGGPTSIDRAALKRLIQANAERQRGIAEAAQPFPAL
jgi:hypothetical protein